MSTAVPARLKDAQIAQFAHRAAQLEKVKPILTYWRMRTPLDRRVALTGSSEILHDAEDYCEGTT
jgi:vacuolar protein sorting-associated protein VTA1